MEKRAVSEDQKRDKQQAILRVAARLFSGNSFEEISMARIAKASRVAKGTVFLYFATKEELFLALLESLLQDWTKKVAELLTDSGGDGEAGGTAAALTASLQGRRDLLRLLAILHTRIEVNISQAAALRFRQLLAREMELIAGKLRGIHGSLTPDESRQAVFGIYSLLIGVQHLASPAANLRDCLSDRELLYFPDDFTVLFRRLCGDYLNGLLHHDGTLTGLGLTGKGY